MPLTLLVAVSMNATEFEPFEIAIRVRWSGEKPRPWTLSSPLYSGDSTSGRALPRRICPSKLLLTGLITETVLLFWSAV
ncbi:hypothetical protein D3C87_2000030 [compost metagenome]